MSVSRASAGAGSGRHAASRSRGTAGLIVRYPRRAGRRPAHHRPRASTISVDWWLAVGFFAVRPRRDQLHVLHQAGSLPLKYLLPGLVFLIVFQLYTMVFTGYASFTNYGTGHLDDKDAAITAIQQGNVVPVEDGREYPSCRSSRTARSRC